MLVGPEWLEAHLADPDLRVIDASWYLPEAGRDAAAEYLDAHIPDATHLDLSRDLSDAGAPVRNTMAAPPELAAAFARAGIGSEHRIVIYDRLGGYSAGRIWWSLAYLGQRRAALLDGGFGRWKREGRPLADGVREPAPARFEPRPEPRRLVGKEEVLRVVRDGGARIVDARGRARFRGEAPEKTRRRGHIPGAVNVPHGENLEGDPPVFRRVDALREVYAAVGVRPGERVITTCGSGVSASLDAFALTLLGHRDVAVYDGSWAEWGDAEDVPVETGA